jgi:tetratricopeptide (TPR) repeat protein
LKSIGYEIPDSHKLVGQVKYETMKERIYDFFTDINTKSEDVLLFYYSGHGVPDVNGDVFLASSEINHDAPFRKGFSFYDLTTTIERSNSTRIVTILDCCYSGAAKISKGHEEDATRLGTVAIDDKSRKLQEQGEGKCLLAASMGYQEAYGLKERGHSIFTYYLLEGFRGTKKAVDEEGNVTPDSLGKYVYREIINLPKEKRPKQKPIRKVEAGGDIILAQYPELTKKEPTQDPYESIQDATEFLKKGDYPSAIQYSDKALAINPRISVAYSIKGQALYNLKKYDEALVCYNKALELRPRYLEVLNYKAIVLNDLGKYEEAIESLNQSTDLNPNDAIIWNSKGLAFSKVRKYNEAIECFDIAIKLNPTYAEALKNEHTALSNLRQELHDKQEKTQEHIQGQIEGIDDSSKDTKIETISAPKTKDTNTATFNVAAKVSPSDLATTKDIPLPEESSQEKKKEVNLSRPREGIQPQSPVFPSQQIPKSYDRQQRSAIRSSLKEDNDSSKSGRYISAPGGEEKHSESIHQPIREQSQQINLKKFLPIIIIGVVGSIIAFAIFGTMTSPPEVTTTPTDTTTPSTPPETTPSTPPETTPSTPPETTPSTPPETTPSTPPETTPSTPPETQNKYGDAMTTFEEEAGGPLPQTTTTAPSQATTTTSNETTTTGRSETPQNEDTMTTFEELGR